jgi:hypothetical protein
MASKHGRGTFVHAAAALLLALAMASPLSFAQNKKSEQNDRSVRGTVTSAEDAPVSGAVVQLKNTKSLQIRSFITKEDGGFHFEGVSPDVDYQLRADYRGSASPTKTVSSFDSRKDVVINLKLGK